MPYSSLSLGDGALVTTAGLDLILPNADQPEGTLLLDYRPGADRADVDRRISAQLEELGVAGLAMPPPTPDGLRVLSAVRHFPLLVAAAVGVLAVAVVGQLVVTSTRRRRFDLAVLGALGCVRRQLGAVVSWHATTLALAACVVGIPLGVAAGRWAWGFVRQDLGATAATDVSWAAVVLVAPVAVLAANAVAAIPAWRARRVDQAAALGAQQ
jgi:predicted lysophospholipase L1 biosynthesis ABC-type transport system permease subunit